MAEELAGPAALAVRGPVEVRAGTQWSKEKLASLARAKYRATDVLARAMDLLSERAGDAMPGPGRAVIPGAWRLPLLLLVDGAVSGVVLGCHLLGIPGDLQLHSQFIRLGQAGLDRHVRLGCRHGVIVPSIGRACLQTTRWGR